MLAIRRPPGLDGCAAHSRQFLGLLFAIYAGEPQLLFRGPHGRLAVRGDLNILTVLLRTAHLTQHPGCGAFGIYIKRKYLLLGKAA